ALTKALSDDQPPVRHAAVTGLVWQGPTGMPALRQAAAAPDPAVRFPAGVGLGAGAGADNRPRAGEAPGGAGPNVRSAALKSLAGQGALAAPAVPALVKALNDPNPEVRTAAARVLAGVGEPAKEAVPALRVARKDPQEPVRRAAADALKKLG